MAESFAEPECPNLRLDRNGSQLGSKCMLYQGLAQHSSWFAHKREGFGPPLFDSGLEAMRTYGIDEGSVAKTLGDLVVGDLL
jgi:hypothetical protein